jgi:hypothetical protein
MRTRSLVISATLISALVLALAVIAMATDPLVGTWKMIPSKSTSSSPPDKSYTITVEAQGNSYKTVQDFVTADNKPLHRSWTAKYDGKDYPVTAPDMDAISIKQPNANTVVYVAKKNGKEAWSGQAVVSKDGKTMTDKGGGKDANGKAFTYIIVMEKQ